MKTQGRPQSSNIIDARNYNQFQTFILEQQSELAWIGQDLMNAVTAPFGGPGYLVLPTNYKSTYVPPVNNQPMGQMTQPRNPKK